MALVRLLVEFYRLPQLKLPLKFEVEILAGLLEFHISGTSTVSSLFFHVIDCQILFPLNY